MAKLGSNAKKKLRKALRRVDVVVIKEIRRMIEQQRKWKAKVVNSRAGSN